MAVAQSGQIGQGGGPALGVVGDPVVVLQSQACVTARDDAPRVPFEEGRPDGPGKVAPGRVDRRDVHPVGDDQMGEGGTELGDGRLDWDRSDAWDLAQLIALGPTAAQGVEVGPDDQLGPGVGDAVAGGGVGSALAAEDARPGEESHQGVGPVGIGGLKGTRPPGLLEVPVRLGLQSAEHPGPRLRGEHGLQTERSVVVGEASTPAVGVEAAGVTGLVLGRSALRLGPLATVLQSGQGVVLGRPDQVGFPARIDPGRLGDQGGPPPGELPLAEGVLQVGLIGQLLAEPDEPLGLAEGLPGLGGQQFRRRAVAGAHMEVPLGHPGRRQGPGRGHHPFVPGQPVEHLGAVLRRVPARVVGGDPGIDGVEAGEQVPRPTVTSGHLGPVRALGLSGGHCHGDSQSGGCITATPARSAPPRPAPRPRRAPARAPGPGAPGPAAPGPGAPGPAAPGPAAPGPASPGPTTEPSARRGQGSDREPTPSHRGRRHPEPELTAQTSGHG